MELVWYLLVFSVILGVSLGSNTTMPVYNETTHVSVVVDTNNNCSRKESIIKRQSCIANLMHWLQRNPKANCSVEHDKFLDCMVKVEKSCLKYEGHDLKRQVGSWFKQESVCDHVWFYLPPNRTYIFYGFYCKVGQSEQIRKQQNGCAAKFVAMWQNNRADKKICGEYVNVKKCMRKLVDDAACNKTQQEQMSLDVQLGNFNPYCPSGVDPVVTENGSSIKDPSPLLLAIFIAMALFKTFKI